MKILQKILAIALISIMLTACSPTGAVTEEKQVTIGGLFALSGYGAQWGTTERNAVELAITQANNNGGINGKQIMLSVEDTQTDAITALNAYYSLSNNNQIQVIIGPTWEESAQAIMPVAKNNKQVIITPSSYDTVAKEQSTQLFSTYTPFAYQITALVPHFKEHDMKRFAIVYAEEFFANTMADLFKEQAKINGWEVIAYKIPTQTKDYKTVIMKIQEQNVDGIYCLLWDPDMGTFMKQMHEQKFKKPMFSVDSAEDYDLLRNYGTYMEGIVYPVPVPGKTYDAFEEAYTTKYKEKPMSMSGATAYDATNLVIEALRTGANTPQEIAKYLHARKPYEGASGTITFDENGIISERTFTLRTIRNNKFVNY